MANNLNVGLGIDFQPGAQTGLISNRGVKMIHEIGVTCPKCRTADPHANMVNDGKLQTRSPNCPNCGGDGVLFRKPKLITGLAVGIRQQRNVHDIGEAQPGDMQFSVGPGLGDCGNTVRRVSRSDKFTATWDQTLDEGQTLVRGAGYISDNARLVNNVETSEDRLWYEPKDALHCEDEHGVEYTQNTDFVLGPGRVIRWVGNQPTIRTKYTLNYTAFLEWIAWIPPQERRDRNNRDLGPLVFLRRRHVAFINDSPLITETDRIPLSGRTSC